MDIGKEIDGVNFDDICSSFSIGVDLVNIYGINTFRIQSKKTKINNKMLKVAFFRGIIHGQNLIGLEG